LEAANAWDPSPKRTASMPKKMILSAVVMYHLTFGSEAFSLIQGILLSRIRPAKDVGVRTITTLVKFAENAQTGIVSAHSAAEK